MGRSAGNRRDSKEKEHNATMIVVTDHLSFPFQSSQTWGTILQTNDPKRLPDVQVLLHQGISFVSLATADFQMHLV